MALVAPTTAQMQAARDLSANAGLETATDIVTSRFSETDLAAANEWISDRITAANRGAKRMVGVAVAPSRNRIEISVPSGVVLTAQQLQLVDSASALYGDRIEVVYTVEDISPSVCTAGTSSCTSPVRGGMRIQSSRGSCTAGFIGEDASFSPPRRYVYTAGHCINLIGEAWQYRRPDGTMTSFGTSDFGVYGDADFGVIRITSATEVRNTRNWVLVNASSGSTTFDDEYQIRSVGSSTVGQRICLSGAVTQTSCGTVSRLGATVTYSDGTTVKNMGETNICGSMRGNSGGPMYARNTGFGLHSGAGSCNTYYQGLRAAASRRGVPSSQTE